MSLFAEQHRSHYDGRKTQLDLRRHTATGTFEHAQHLDGRRPRQAVATALHADVVGNGLIHMLLWMPRGSIGRMADPGRRCPPQIIVMRRLHSSQSQNAIDAGAQFIQTVQSSRDPLQLPP